MRTSTKGKSQVHCLSTLFKRSLVCAAVFGVIGTGHAQQSPDESNDEVDEVIEIRGIRASSAANLNIKRLSNSVVDAITAEDIGKFPDKNVADALQRVPGIVIQRSGGEGETVSIRGLGSDRTFTQLNGNFIASSPGRPERSFSYSLLPSNLVGRVEVYKSSEARLDEGGIGGTVIVNSRKPLDLDANSGALNLEYTYADITDKYEPQFSAIYSWKNKDENLGLLVGYVSQDRLNRSQLSSINIQNSNFRYSELRDGQLVPNGASGFSPQSFVQQVVDEDRERTGIQITAQWRPTERLELGFNYFQFKLGLDSIVNQLEYPEWHNNSSYWTDVYVDAEAEWVTGIDYSVGAGGQEEFARIPRINGEFIIEESTSDTYDLFGEYEGDNYNLRFRLGHTESEGGPTQKYRAAYYSGAVNEDGTVENSSQFYGWRHEDKSLITYMDPQMFANLQNGIGGEADPGATDSSFETGVQEEDYAQIDVDWDIDWNVIETLRFGAKYRDNKIRRDTRNTLYLPFDFDFAAAEARGGVTRDDDYGKNGGIPLLTEVLADQPMQNLSGAINTNLFPAVNWHRYEQLLNERFQRYTRFEDDFVFEVQEEITSFYGQADYKHNNIRGNFGVRIVKTTTTNGSSDRFEYLLDRTDADGNELPESEQVRRDVLFVTKENDDTHVLPSFNIVFDLADDWVLRGAAAKVLSRPEYNQLGSFQRLTYRSNEWAADSSARPDFDPIRDAEGWTGSGGNSSLEPLEATQFDISLEYYYGDGSGASIAFFRKEIDNFIVPLSVDVNRTVPEQSITLPNGSNFNFGGDINVRNFGTVANGSDAESDGIEVAWQHFFENGFGFYTNYTKNDTSLADITVEGEVVGQSPLVGTADYSFNLSAFYESDLYSVRASYVATGPSVGGAIANYPSNGETTNRYVDSYDQVDLNASYNITDDLTVTASVINLTKSESYTHLGNDTKVRFQSNGYGGRRFFAGVNYRF